MRYLHINNLKLSVLPIAENRYIIRNNNLDELVELPLIAQSLRSLSLKEIVDVSATDIEILVHSTLSISKLISTIKSQFSKDITSIKSKHYILPVCFAKALDWDYVEQASKLSKSEIISKILSTKLHVSMMGFIPGFAYLTGLDEALHVDRMNNPRTKVVKGSFAIGGKYAGVYPFESPGGWRVIGNCPLKMFDYSQDMQSQLNINDTISVQKITVKEWESLRKREINIQSFK